MLHIVIMALCLADLPSYISNLIDFYKDCLLKDIFKIFSGLKENQHFNLKRYEAVKSNYFFHFFHLLLIY